MTDQTVPEDVRDFLSATLPAQAAVSVPVDEATLLAAVGAPSGADKEEVPESERIHVPMDPTYNESQPTAAKVMGFVVNLPNIGNVQPTEAEKILFLKKFMFDDPIEFEITLPTGVAAVLRTRTEFQSQAIFEALAIMTEKKQIPDPSIGFTLLQQMSAAFQLVSLQGRPFAQLGQSDDWSVRHTAEVLIDHVRHNFATMGTAKWTAVLTCLRIFQAKISVCENQLANESFWLPAS